MGQTLWRLQLQIKLTHGKTHDLIRQRLRVWTFIVDLHMLLFDALAATRLIQARKQERLTGPWTRCNSGPKCDALSCSTWSKQKSDPVESNWRWSQNEKSTPEKNCFFSHIPQPWTESIQLHTHSFIIIFRGISQYSQHSLRMPWPPEWLPRRCWCCQCCVHETTSLSAAIPKTGMQKDLEPVLLEPFHLA